MKLVAAIIAVTVGLFGGGGTHAKHVAQERFPQHCSPYSISYGSLPHALGYTRGDSCAIVLAYRLRFYPFALRCTILVHEFGHLAGFPDMRVPHIMQRAPPIHKPCL